MPIRRGWSPRTLAANIAAEIKAGRDPAQASAIAYETARKAWRSRHPRAAWPAHLKPVRAAGKRKTARNPAPDRRRPDLEAKARKSYSKFHGEPPRNVKQLNVPDAPPTGWILGRVVAVAYEAVRDGETAIYEHEFTRPAAPYLVVSPDGRALHFGGGKYRVTDRGIEDRGGRIGY